MRPIKFRAWDKELKEFVSQSFNMVIRINENLENERFEFMQFTGLLDKNGKEIYENDICRVDVDDGYIGTVYFEDGAFQFDSTVLSDSVDDIEIIGNIYENPNLLTPKE